MKLSELKNYLKDLETINFRLPDGTSVPEHFHVTEVGKIVKNFIDCGGTVRDETIVNFQLWYSSDYDHRLGAEKLLKIIALSENVLQIGDHEIEVEYQSDTIGKYGLSFRDGYFYLESLQTDCLAKENCGIPAQKPRIRMSALGQVKNSCEPGGKCC